MEQEAPKVEETVVKETVVIETVVTEEVKAPAEPVVARPSFSASIRPLLNYATKIDRTTKIFLVVFAAFGLLLLGSSFFKGVFIVAQVNGSPISRLSVIQELEKQAGKNVLDTMITKKLINDEIKKQGVVVTAADIDAEIKKTEAQIGAQGGTLEMALAGQGMTLDELREQIMINKALEQILADKIVVSDEEVSQYLSTAKTPAAQGLSSADQAAQAQEQLKGQKFSKEASQWVKDLKAKAAIDYYVQYE